METKMKSRLVVEFERGQCKTEEVLGLIIELVRTWKEERDMYATVLKIDCGELYEQR